MRWLWTAVVRPMVMYGSIVWSRQVTGPRTSTLAANLNPLNRLAALTWGPIRKSTPTAGLELFGYLPPLDLYASTEAALALYRIKSLRAEIWDGVGGGKYRGHRLLLRKQLDLLGIVDRDWDKGLEVKKWERGYAIDRSSFQTGNDCLENTRIYTDGSKMKGRVGAGFVVMTCPQTDHTESFFLGTDPTVFQAEVVAVDKAAEWATEHTEQLCLLPQQPLIFLSDSQAALQALDAPSCRSKTVASCVEKLDKLAKKVRVCLRWIKAHVGHVGNEKADAAAKEGAEKDIPVPDLDLPVPRCQLRKDARSGLEKLWAKRLRNREDCRQSKMMWPEPNRSKSMALIGRNRWEVGPCIQLLSGHNYYARHMTITQELDDPTCRLCGEDEESSYHIVAECPVLANQRQTHLGYPLLQEGDLGTWCMLNFNRFTINVAEKFDACTANSNADPSMVAAL